MNASLLVRSGPLQGNNCPIALPRLIVGRADDCDLILSQYERVSRHHVHLEWNEHVLTICDQNSTNGVLVNGKKVQQATLKNGDQLVLGDFSATVVIEGVHSSSGLADTLRQKWNAWAAPPPQKWGIVFCVGIVLLLGGIGMQPSTPPVPPADAPSATPPTVTAPTDTFPAVKIGPSQIPDASTAANTPSLAPIEPVDGRISPEAIQNAKAATVLIIHRYGDSYAMGSGFALTDSKRIITNRHVVVDDKGTPQDCLLIFEAGTPRQRKLKVPAKNITLAPLSGDQDLFQDDLASISLESGQTPALPAGKSEDLNEIDEVYALGFPLGIRTLTLNNELPSVSVKPSIIERLQRDQNGAVTVIQLGSSVTYGNSGGPVINKRGEVIGVIRSRVRNTSMGYAIPMVFVNSLP